jgi:hypothetical protein
VMTFGTSVRTGIRRNRRRGSREPEGYDRCVAMAEL